MSFSGNFFDEEIFHLSLLRSLGLPEPCITDCLQNQSNGPIPVSMNVTNPLMSSQQSNLLTYEENSTTNYLHFDMSQVEQGHNGFPTMTNSPIHPQGLLIPSQLIHEEKSNTFSSLFHTESIGSQNCVSYQITQQVTYSVNMYGLQVPTPPVNNSVMTNPAILNQTNMIPTFNHVDPQSNISSIPQPQVSSSFTSSDLQTGNQSSSRFSNLNTQTHERPNANSTIHPQLRTMLDLLVHASQCSSPPCQYLYCRKMKGLFRHGSQCEVRASGGCIHCKKMWYLLVFHARECEESECLVPRCRDLKEYLRRLQ